MLLQAVLQTPNANRNFDDSNVTGKWAKWCAFQGKEVTAQPAGLQTVRCIAEQFNLLQLVDRLFAHLFLLQACSDRSWIGPEDWADCIESSKDPFQNILLMTRDVMMCKRMQRGEQQQRLWLASILPSLDISSETI